MIYITGDMHGEYFDLLLFNEMYKSSKKLRQKG